LRADVPRDYRRRDDTEMSPEGIVWNDVR